MPGYLDRAAQITLTPGTGSPLQLDGVGVPPYRDWTTAGAVNGQTYDYVILDALSPDGPNAWEVCHGVFSSAGPSITRITDASSLGGTTPITLSGTAYISMEPCANTLNSLIPQTFTYPRVDLSGLSTYTFSGIDQNYNDLEFLMVGRTTVVGLSGDPLIRVNGLSTAIYSVQRQFAQNTSPSADQTLVGTSFGSVDIPGTTALAGIVGFWEIEIFDYPGLSGLEKVGAFRGRQPNSTTTHNCFTLSGTMDIALTAPITSLTVALVAGAWTAGSYAQLRLKT